MKNKSEAMMIPNVEGLLPLQNHVSDKKTLQKLLRTSDQRINLQAFPIAKVTSIFYHKILAKNDNENDYQT